MIKLIKNTLLLVIIFCCLTKNFVFLDNCNLHYFIFLLILVAYFTLAERKIMGSIQRRKGPNVIGWFKNL